MKKLLLVLLGLVALVVVAVLVALPNADRFRGPIQAALEKQLNRQVKLGALGMSWSPLAVRVQQVEITEAGGKPFLSADELLVRAQLLPLLRGRLDIDRLLVRGAKVELRRNAAGQWNYEDLGGGGEGASGDGGFSLKELALEKFILGVTTGARSEYGPLDLTLRTQGTDSYQLEARLEPGTVLPAPLTLAAGIETPAGQVRLSGLKLQLAGLTLTGNATVNRSTEPAQVTASLAAPETDLDAVLKPLKTGMKGTGRIAANIEISGTTADPVVKGTARLSQARIETPELTQPVQIRSAQLRFSQRDAEATGLDAALGNSQVRGMLALRSFEPLTVAFDLKSDHLDADELQKLSAGSKQPATPSKPLNLRGGGKLSAARFTGSGMEFQNLEAQCRLAGQVLQLDPVTASLYDGRVSGSITAPLGTSRQPVQIKLQMAKVNAAPLLGSATSLKNVLSGVLSGESDLTIAPGPDVARGLNGTLKIDLAGGRLNGVQILNEMALVGKFTGFQKTAEQFTNINKLGGSLTIKDGVASTEDLSLAFDGGSLTAAGQLGLADRQVKLKILTTLTSAMASKFGGASAPGWMTAFLQNAKGEMVIPALVTGTMDQPRFAPDAARLAEMKVMPLFQGAQSPKQVVEGVKGLFDSFRKPAGKKDEKQEKK